MQYVLEGGRGFEVKLLSPKINGDASTEFYFLYCAYQLKPSLLTNISSMPHIQEKEKSFNCHFRTNNSHLG